jgi:hypothetical protein
MIQTLRRGPEVVYMTKTVALDFIPAKGQRLECNDWIGNGFTFLVKSADIRLADLCDMLPAELDGQQRGEKFLARIVHVRFVPMECNEDQLIGNIEQFKEYGWVEDPASIRKAIA